MKMIKETSEVKNKEEPNNEKKKESETKELSSNSKDINIVNSGINNININSEQTKFPKKDIQIQIVNKELETKNKLEIEDNQNKNKNIESLEKENLNLSPLEEKPIINNNKSNTPIKPQSSPLNFQLKRNANFQMKSRKNTFTEGDYNQKYINSMNIKSPIYSYYDQSQKYLSANYNGENYFNYSENKGNKKTLEQEEISKKIKKEENSENLEKQMIKTDKSIEHENESMNYNDFNLFNSPENHDSSQVSAGLNNMHTNKISRKSSQATVSFKRGNSQNNFIYTGGAGESDNIDFNMEMPVNESIDEHSNNYININNEEMKSNKDNIINNNFNNNDNLAFMNLGNPWLNINNNYQENTNNDNQLKALNNINNNNNNLSLNNNGNNLKNLLNINYANNQNSSNNINGIGSLIQNLNNFKAFNNSINSNNLNNIDLNDIHNKLLLLKSQNQNKVPFPIQKDFQSIQPHFNFLKNYPNIPNTNMQHLQNLREIQYLQNLLNIKRIQDLKNQQQVQNIQNLQNISNLNNLNKLNYPNISNSNINDNINSLLLNQNQIEPNTLLYLISIIVIIH